MLNRSYIGYRMHGSHAHIWLNEQYNETKQ